MEYVPQRYYQQVVQYLDNYRKAKQILKEISNINLELLRRRDKL